jgi:hypothetical protein
MQVPFAAYADDCTLLGQLEFEADRLSDYLAQTDELEVTGAAFRALDDGRVVEADSAEVLRGDLCVIVASGPRGRPELRLWTRQYPVRARIGPYGVTGYLHAPPTVDPLNVVGRKAIVALTSSVVEYELGGRTTYEPAEVVLLNRRKIDSIQSVPASEIGAPPEAG